MQPVRLERGDGHLVNDEACIPCDSLPEILVWRKRLFRLHCIDREHKVGERDLLIYREVSHYVIPEEEAGNG